MRKLAAFLLLALLGPPDPPLLSEVSYDRLERIPTLTADKAFPRWLAYVAPTARITNGIVHTGNYSNGRSVAVDSRHVSHVVTRNDDPAYGTWSIAYQNNRLDTRLSNGFSEPALLDAVIAPDLDILGPPDVWIDGSDRIHVVWSHIYYDNVGNLTHSKIWYQRKDSGGWLPAAVDLTPATVPGVRKRYLGPQVAIDSTGLAHVVSAYSELNASGLLVARKAVHITYAGSGSPSPVTIIADSAPFEGNTDNYHLIRFALDSANHPTAVWQEFSEATFTHQVFHSTNSGGGWSLKLPFGGTGSNQGPDIAIDPQDNSKHLVWVRVQPTTSVRYAHNFAAESQVSSAAFPDVGPSNYYGARIVLDSRRQIHVAWAGLSYAARVRNPDHAVVNPAWRLQETASVPPGSSMYSPSEIAISRNDQIFVVDSRYYTRTMEYGLGVRDGMAMAGAFPGASINAASGNLHFSLGLYSTAGVGPAQSCSLFYNSLEPYGGGLLSQGWKLNVEVTLVDHWVDISSPSESVTLFQADGRPIHFNFSGAFGYSVAENEYGNFDKLERLSGTLASEFRLTTKHGLVLTFNTRGKLREIKEPTRNHLTLAWNPTTGLLDNIVDMLGNGGGGRSAALTYETGSNPLYAKRVATIVDPGLKVYTLGYTGNHLTTVAFSSGPGTPTYGFEYAAANNKAAGERINLPKRFLPPRGQAATTKYGWTCGHLQDNRITRVEDPQAMLVTEAGAELSAIAPLDMVYDETTADPLLRRTTLVNRRGFQSRFRMDARRSLVRKFYDPTCVGDDDDNDANDGADGLHPVIRAFDGYGSVLNVQDRWGFNTSYTYHDTALPAHVKDNLHEVRRPKAAGAGFDLVATYTYTADEFNNIDLEKTYCTPADAQAVQERITDHDYNASGQATKITFPSLTRPDEAVQADVNRRFDYLGPRAALSKITNEEGHYREFTSWHGVHGLPLSTQREGDTQSETMDYDVMGHRTHHTLPQGGAGNEIPGPTVIKFDDMWRVERITDPKGQATVNGYDIDSNLTSVAPSAGDPTSTAYDTRGLPTGGSTPDGNWTRKVDANGNARKRTSLRTYESQADFDGLDRAVETRVPGATVAGGGGGPQMRTLFLHDGFDLATSTHFSTVTEKGAAPDPDRVTKTTYDNRGRPKNVLAPDALTLSESFFDEQDQLIARQLKFNGVFQTCTVLVRDRRDRVEQERLQDGAFGGTVSNSLKTFTLYNRAGSVVTVVDPLGVVTNPASFAHKVTYVLDSRERVQFVKDGLGVIVRENVYGDDDLVAEVKVPDPVGKSVTRVTAAKYAYTKRKEIKTSLNANDKGPTYAYLSLPGQVDTVTDALGRIRKTTYHADTQRVDETIRAYSTPKESKTKHVWTSGLLTRTTAWNPATLGYGAHYDRAYDQADRLEKLEAPLVSPEQTLYNAFSEVNQSVAGAKTVVLQRNKLGQNTQADWTGAFTGRQAREYTATGLPKSVKEIDPISELTIRRREMSHHIWKSAPDLETFSVGLASWKTQTHTIDDAGNYTSFKDAEAALHQWPVDANNRPTEIKLGAHAIAGLAYTPGGLPDTTTLKDASGAVIAVTTHEHDALGRKSRQRAVQHSTGSVLSDLRWAYTHLDQVETITLAHLGVVITLGYDERGELEGESTPGNAGGLGCPAYANQIGGPATGNESLPSAEPRAIPSAVLPVPARSASYVIDPAGNRTSQTIDGVTTTFVHNAASQLTTESSPGKSVSHLFDAWGNETTRTTAAGATSTVESFGYSHLGLLSSYVKQVDASIVANWQYDSWPTGERYAKTNLLADTKELYIPRFGDVATEYTQTGANPIQHANTYAQGTGIDQKATRIAAGTGLRRHFLGDLVGTIGMTLDDAAATTETSVKDAWGVPIAGGSGERYSGLAQRELDPESGLVHMRWRMYDPRLGRFTQNDPIRGNRPFKQYTYGSNNPVNRIDPWGLQDGKPVEREAYGKKYTCRCSDDSFLGIFNLGRNYWPWNACQCWHGNLRDHDQWNAQRLTYTAVGAAIVEGSRDALRMTGGGLAPVAGYEIPAGHRLTVDPNSPGIGTPASRTDLAIEAAKDLVLFGAFSALGLKLGEWRADALQPLPGSPFRTSSNPDELLVGSKSLGTQRESGPLTPGGARQERPGVRVISPVGDPARPLYSRGHPGTPVVDHVRARALGGHPTDASNLHVKPWEWNARKGAYEGQLLRERNRLIREGLTPAQADEVLRAELDWIMNDVHARPMDPKALDRIPDPKSIEKE